jgi:hypothetical protein
MQSVAGWRPPDEFQHPGRSPESATYQTEARLIPRNQLRGSTIDLLQPPQNLPAPSFPGQALHQAANQRGSRFKGQGQGVF